VARHQVVELDRLAALHEDDLVLAPSLLDLPLVHVLPRACVETFDVEVLHVEAEVRDAPRDTVVVAHDHRRYARQSCARDVQPRRSQMDYVPRRRQAPLEVRIVGEDRLAGRSARARQHPRVRSNLNLDARARWVELLHKNAFAARNHRRLAEFDLPRAREVAVHVHADRDRVGDRPRPRVIAEHRELDRQRTCRFEKVIDAARVRCKPAQVLGLHLPRVFFGRAPHAHAARLAVDLDHRRADDFGERARCKSADCVHLPQPVLRGNVPLKE
jgi:hypothetical protein